MLLAASPAHAFKIMKSCDATATANLTMSANFIENNMQAIVTQFTFLTEKQRQEIARKWPGLNIDCTDGASRCGKAAAAFAHGGAGNQINVCHAKLVDIGADLCLGALALMHEIGHAHGFRKIPGHNDPTAFIVANDPMYLMGNITQATCTSMASAGTITNTAYAGTPRLVLGAACSKDVACRSGKCTGGACVCNDDTDCAAGQNCFRPVGKPNFCAALPIALGGTCSKDSQCASNKCEGAMCVCQTNADCTGGASCLKRAGVNICATANLAIGAACSFDGQCATGKCERGGVCACAKDADCGANFKCSQPIGRPNVCEAR